MKKLPLFIVSLAATLLFACGFAEDMQRGLDAERAVVSEIERWQGVDAEVGWTYTNGRLAQVSVVLASDQLVGVDISQFVEQVAPMVAKHFGEKPGALVISVVVDSSEY